MGDKKEYKRIGSDVSLFQLSNYVKPQVEELAGVKWVLNGKNNSFFQYTIDRYNGSPTNKAIIDAYKHLIYGQGVAENNKKEIYKDLNEIFSKKEQRKCIADFYEFGQYDMQILRAKGGGKIAQILHIPTNKLGMEKLDKDGKINGVWYSDDWSNVTKYPPNFIPAFEVSANGNTLKHAISVKSVRPYSAGKTYFSDPSYLAGMQYAETEEEISNFFINHIQNGLSFGYIINFNNGDTLTDQEKDEIERQIHTRLTGTSNAGKFLLSFNNGKEAEVTIVPLEVNDAHNQWQFLTDEARQQLITAHGVFPNLFGIATSNGLSNNADELDVQSKMLQDYQIMPRQQLFIDELAPIIEINGLSTDLYFIPLRDSYKSTEEAKTEVNGDPKDETVDEADEVKAELSKSYQPDARALIALGEDVSPEEWDFIEERVCNELSLSESQLNTVFQFAALPKTDGRLKSEQDTSLFKIRYKYSGAGIGENDSESTREFCALILNANKVYRAEDLNKKLDINSDFAPKGETEYNIFSFKGGVNCQHWWERVIFLKKGNKQIGVNDARKLILKLDPKDRKDAKWVQNDSQVAQAASPSNNWWSLKPNYRDSGVIPSKN
jgi:hypothetical protein